MTLFRTKKYVSVPSYVFDHYERRKDFEKFKKFMFLKGFPVEERVKDQYMIMIKFEEDWKKVVDILHHMVPEMNFETIELEPLRRNV